jgi:uncharacterized protein
LFPDKKEAERLPAQIMLLDLNDILHESGQVMIREFRLEPDDVKEVILTEAAQGEIRVQNARRNIVITGQADTAVQLSCARCLQRFSYPLQLAFEAAAPISLFQLPGQVAEEPSHEEDDLLDDEIRALFVDHNLNVSELVRQTVWLQIPINPICSENCGGLAHSSSAGQNTDPRLDKLKNWHGNEPA